MRLTAIVLFLASLEETIALLEVRQREIEAATEERVIFIFVEFGQVEKWVPLQAVPSQVEAKNNPKWEDELKSSILAGRVLESV